MQYYCMMANVPENDCINVYYSDHKNKNDLGVTKGIRSQPDKSRWNAAKVGGRCFGKTLAVLWESW